MSTKFSIIVCAYNAANRIKEPLEHICRLDYPSDSLELIIIDNNSTDKTSQVVSEVLNASQIEFDYRIIKEKKQGLIHARIAGIMNANYDYLVFCDDDNLLKESYLKNAAQILTKNSDIGAIGGQVNLKTDLNLLPPWFYSYSNAYAVGSQSLHSGDVSRRGYLWGAGIVIKKSLLKVPIKKGISFALSGRDGNKLTSGDDSEMCKWILISGHKLFYSSNLELTHVIPSERINETYIDSLLKALTDSGTVLNVYDRWLWRRKCRKQVLKKPILWLSSEFRFLKSSNSTKRRVVDVINQLVDAYNESKS